MSRPFLYFCITVILGVIGFVGISSFLDHRFPRATAIVQIHPFQIPLNPFNRASGYSYMENEYANILSPETISLAEQEFGLPFPEKTNQAELVADSITISPIRGTDFLRITAKNDDPEKAARIANAIARAYAKRRNESYKKRLREALQDLEEKMATQEVVVQETQREFESSSGNNDLPGPTHHDFDDNDLVERSFQKHQLSQAKRRYEEARALFRQMKIYREDARAFLLSLVDRVTIHQLAE